VLLIKQKATNKPIRHKTVKTPSLIGSGASLILPLLYDVVQSSHVVIDNRLVCCEVTAVEELY